MSVLVCLSFFLFVITNVKSRFLYINEKQSDFKVLKYGQGYGYGKDRKIKF